MIKNTEKGDICMKYLWILLGIAAFAALAILLITYICFRMAFYSAPRKRAPILDDALPPGPVYAPYRQQMRQLAVETKGLPCESVSITSFDGLRLYGKYYEFDPSAPIELMFPGYRGLAIRDLCGGVQRAFAVGRNVLLVDQRACGECDGNVISFGINERQDCLSWLNFMIQRFGKDVQIVLAGVSMGAATVTMAAGMEELPENVIGVVADSGYSSPREIICKVIGDMGLPAKLAYPFVKLAAKLYGRFDLEAASSMEAVQNSKVPIFFSHGEADDFVPCEMTVRLHEACASEKTLKLIPGAGHGLCYLADPDGYVASLKNAF